MRNVTPEIRQMARALVEAETAGEGTFRVCGKLQAPLATLMGQGGFCALLTRALSIAEAELPWLQSWQVQRDGMLAVPAGSKAGADAAGMAEGEAVLVAQMIGLLIAFIGKELTVQTLREVWPNLPSADFRTFGA